MIGDTRARLDGLQVQAAAVHAVWEMASAKIAEPVISTPPTVDAALESTLRDIRDRADAGCWLDASRALDALASDLDALDTKLTKAAEASRATLAQRDHLRGRLDAYRAKAHGLGLDEDDEVTSAYEQALDALHVSPADLTHASALLTEYQRLLTPTPEPEARR